MTGKRAIVLCAGFSGLVGLAAFAAAYSVAADQKEKPRLYRLRT